MERNYIRVSWLQGDRRPSWDITPRNMHKLLNTKLKKNTIDILRSKSNLNRLQYCNPKMCRTSKNLIMHLVANIDSFKII